MEPTRTNDAVLVGGDARQRLYHARGYGTPTGQSDLRLAPVEAAYLLYRDDIPPVDGAGFEEFCRRERDERFLIRFLVYKDLRERGFYLVPRRDDDLDFVVYERGTDPTDEHIEYTIRVLDERRPIDVDGLRPGVLAIVDEEGEVGYVAVTTYEPDGNMTPLVDLDARADRVGNRFVVWDPPSTLYEESFYGQPLAGRTAGAGAVQLSLVETRYLAERDLLDVDSNAIRHRGEDLEGTHRFGARERVYRALRDAGTVPKTGFKFGADFRVYHDFAHVEDMGHSDVLVRVLDSEEAIAPAAIALDVRLAHGVGKRMVFAHTGATHTTSICWLSVTRLTP